jgi:hypothetical protein
MDLVDLEFFGAGVFGRKKMEWSCFVDLELRGALPNTPLTVS